MFICLAILFNLISLFFEKYQLKLQQYYLSKSEEIIESKKSVYQQLPQPCFGLLQVSTHVFA